MAWHVFGGQKATVWQLDSFSIPWSQGIELRLSGLVASTFAHGTISQALVWSDFPCFLGNSVVSS